MPSSGNEYVVLVALSEALNKAHEAMESVAYSADSETNAKARRAAKDCLPYAQDAFIIACGAYKVACQEFLKVAGGSPSAVLRAAKNSMN